MEKLGFTVVKFQRRLGSDAFRIRLCRLSDIPVTYRGFKLGVFPGMSALHFLVWVMKTFQALYLIEVRRAAVMRIVGFIGLYGMRSSREARLSMAIFDPRDRGAGLGRKAAGLFLISMAEGKGIEAMTVEISTRNYPSLRLFRGLGFESCGREGANLLLTKHLAQSGIRKCDECKGMK